MLDEELMFTNAFIGFCKPAGKTWPCPFAVYGYEPYGVEREVSTFVSGKSKEVVPELVCSSSVLSHSIALEAKSATIRDGQAKAYKSLSASELITQGFFSSDVDPNVATHDSLLVCSAKNSEALLADLARSGVDLPLIECSDSLFTLANGRISKSEIHDQFEQGIQVSPSDWPTHFVPISSKSPEPAMAPTVISALAALLISGSKFSLEDLAKRSIPHWDLCGQREQKAFRGKILSIVLGAGREELSGYFSRLGKAQVWQSSVSKGASAQALDKLANLATEYVKRIRLGIEYRPGQPRLIPDVMLEEPD